MKCGWRLAILPGLFLVAIVWLGGSAAGQDQKKIEKKKEEDGILGKSYGEWIKILREHKDPKLRKASLIALEYGNVAGRTGLLAVLEAAEKDEDPQIRRQAVMLLGRLGPETKGALKTLMTVLQNDKIDSIREAAATVIGNKFTEPAQDYVVVLADALKDPHAGTRMAVATALRNMDKNAKPAVPLLMDAARNSNEQPLMRSVAIHVISRHGQDQRQTMPLLVGLLLDEQAPTTVREAAAEGVGRLQTDSAEVIAALGKTLSAKSLELRKAAAVSLNFLGIKARGGWSVIKARLQKSVEPDSNIRNHLIRLTGVLARDQNDAISLLTTLAQEDESNENRIAAIQELGELGVLAKEALTVLSNLASQDARAAVREAAAKAVRQIKGS